jgi:hypothetical protein
MYGTQAFKYRMYKHHRQVVHKTKWWVSFDYCCKKAYGTQGYEAR